MNAHDLLALPMFDNSAWNWLLACATTLGILLIFLILRRLVRRQYARLLATPRIEIMEVPLEILSRTTSLFFFTIALFVGLSTLTMSAGTKRILGGFITVVAFWQIGIWLAAAIKGFLERKQRRSQSAGAAASSLGVVSFIAQVVAWSLVVLLALDNLGVNVTTLIAGLGVGGIAVALAVQNVLGDLLASLSITLDRPFVAGDFLIVDDVLGSVENIGVKSTRLRSLSGEQIIMSNADLLKSRVRNYGRMLERRVVFNFGVTYQTSADLMEEIPKLIREIIESHESIRFDRSHFAKYGPSSLDFETVYYVLSADYNRYMDIQQSINLKILRRFAKLSIEFAYPTQTVHLSSNPTPTSEAQTQ